MASRPSRLTRLPRIGDGKMSFIPNDSDHDGWLLLTPAVRMVGKTMYPKLFAIFGVSYGGTQGGTTFGLPPAGDKFLLMAGTAHALGTTGGTETVTLTTQQIPAHHHTEVKASSAVTPTQQGLLTSVLNIPLQVISKPPTITVTTGDTSDTGGGAAHENMPPFLSVNVFIFAGLPVT